MSADFLSLLQKEAAHQAVLHQKRWLPTQLDGVTSFIGRYPWQVCAMLATLTTGVWRVLQ
jgi:hypothetical protein